jgi:SH3 domain protein
MRKLRRWLLGLVASVPLVAYAETAYITEKLEVPVRSGESREYRIIRYLQAGARVEMLQTYESGYTKIRDERGREGFVLGRYLVDRAPSFVIAGRLEAEVAKQRETIKRLEQDIEALTAQNKSSNESIRMTKDRLAEK